MQVPRTLQSAPEVSRPDSTPMLVIGLLVVVLVLVFWIVSLQGRLRRLGQENARPAPDGTAPGPAFVISPDAAKAGARKGFVDFKLLSRPRWGALLSAPSVERTPLLVRRLDEQDPARNYYYLVPVGPDDDNIGAAARVNGMSGKFIGCSAFNAKGKRPWGSMIAACRTEADTRRVMAARTYSSADKPAATDAREIGIHPTLVWMPCVESRSPYYPFRLISIGGRPKYIRIDGQEFDALTELGPRPGYAAGYEDRAVADDPPPRSRD
jgi:hypothetical protein